MKTRKGYLVVETIEHAHPKLFTYPLLPDDILVQWEDGTFVKECPGIAVGGFELTDAQIATLKPVEFEMFGLDYRVVK